MRPNYPPTNPIQIEEIDFSGGEYWAYKFNSVNTIKPFWIKGDGTDIHSSRFYGPNLLRSDGLEVHRGEIKI